MRKRLGLFLAILMMTGCMNGAASAESKVAPNDAVYGYQKVDFENYNVGDVVITTPKSGPGQFSADGTLYGCVEGDTTDESAEFVIAGDENNKYLKITDKAPGDADYLNFRMVNNNSALNDDMDYFVLKADVKNGDEISNSLGYLGLFRNIRFNDEGSLTGGGSSYQLPKNYGWDEYMFIADKANQKMYTVVNGVITDIVCADDAYASQEKFYYLQFSTLYSKGVGTFYVDNMEMYGVKKETNEVSCTLTPDENNKNVVWAEFTHPVKFSESNITADGATVASVAYENGKYKITSTGTENGYSLIISGVSDVFGAVCPNTEVSVGMDDNKKFGYQKVDFENYNVGDVVITTPKSGPGQFSADGKLYGCVEGDTTNESAEFVIAGDENNKYIKITDKAPGGADYLNFKMMNKDTALNDDMDYFVLKADIKNGDEQSNALPYLGLFRNIRFNNSGKLADTANKNSYQLPKSYDWDEYMFVADKANGVMYTVVNGVITDIVCSSNAYKTANGFYALQFSTQHSSTNGTFYIDNMEMYGVKKETNEVSCTLTPDENNKNVVWAEFTHPVKFSESNITADGATVASVAYENGKYKITSTGTENGYSLIISGVSDVFGAVCPNTEVSVGMDDNKKFGYQKVDFENYNVGDVVITTPKSGPGQFSADGKLYGCVEGDTTNESAEFVIAGDENNKYIKITDKAPGGADYLNFKMMNKDTALNDDMDYFVLKADIKNGDEQSNALPYLGLFRNIRFNNSGKLADTANKNSYQLPKSYDWDEYMFVADKANGVMYTVVNGVIADIVCTDGAYKTANNFYTVQFSTMYSSGVGTFYVDNMEMYGIKAEESKNICTVTPPAPGSSSLGISFNYPTKLEKDNIIIAGGAAVANLSFENGKYIAELSGLAANNEYTVIINSVENIFGVESETLVTSFTTSDLEMEKTYLKTDDRFNGKEDFEHYNNIGIIESAMNSTVDIVSNVSGKNIKDIWPTSTGSQGGVEYSLVKEGDNTVFKIGVPGIAKSGEYSTILQPKPDVNWSKETAGKVYVYSAKFKSGGENESPFYLANIDGYLNIYCQDGRVGFTGKKLYKAFEPGEWVDFKYIVDCTGDTMKHYAIFNGRVIDSYEKNIEIKNGNPRFGGSYAVGGAENCSLYFDDIEIYTTLGISGNLKAELVKAEAKPGEGAVVKFNYPVLGFTTANVSSADEIDDVKQLSDGSWQIRFKAPLAAGSHSVVLSGISDVYGNTLDSAELSFNVVSGGSFEGISRMYVTANNVVIETSNTGAPIENASVVAAGYDANGKLTAIEIKAAQTVKMGNDTFEFNSIGKAVNYKAFIWNSSYAPICSSEAK